MTTDARGMSSPLHPTQSGITLSDEQQDAIDQCLDRANQYVSVTGGPGTGKTTLFRAALAAEAARGDMAAVCAPTGRAAKRVTEASGIPAQTIHRLLEFSHPGDTTPAVGEDGKPIETKVGEPRRNRRYPLPHSVVYVDEASMVSRELMSFLTQALRPGARLRLFGDINQLPPVDGDSPFQGMMDRFPCSTLTHNFRSSDELVMNAYRILQGLMPLRTGERFELMTTRDVLGYVREMVTAEFYTDRWQVITPSNRLANQLNTVMQTVLNPHPVSRVIIEDPFDASKRTILRSGDKVIWTKNDYVFNLFNGTLGTIESIDGESGALDLLADDKIYHIPAQAERPTIRGGKAWYDPRTQISLGYAITTHKAQGSEFDCIIYCINRATQYVTNRQNFYTAVTRARHRVTVLSDNVGFRYALRNVPPKPKRKV